MNENLEAYAKTLEASDEYRVLRRFSCPGSYCQDEEIELQRGVFLDVETTGTDHRFEQIIELAMVPFHYSADGRVFDVGESYVGLQDPGKPLSPFIVDLTGITDEQLKGQRLDPREVGAFLDGISLVVAHNAEFDRPFFEKTFPQLDPLPWACSQREIPWGKLGVKGRKLEYIAYRSGVFFDGHRAEVDCQVGVHVLAQDWLGDGSTALSSLLESSKRVDARLWALGSPFEAKDLLKERGYRWDGGRRVWYRDLPEPQLEAERAWLAANVYAEELQRRGKVKLQVSYVTARERYRGNAQGPGEDFWLQAQQGLFSAH